MVKISIAELNQDSAKYMSLAMGGTQVMVENGNDVIMLTPVCHLSPDADLKRAVTIDNFLPGVIEDVKSLFRK